MSFDFGSTVAETEAWHPPIQDVAPVGNFVFTVVELENTISSGQFPMLKLTLDADEGRQWDNIVISPNEFAVQKLLGLIEAAGLSRPDPKKGEIDAKTGALSDEYANRLMGKKVGGLVRPQVRRVKDESTGAYYDDPEGSTQPRLKGYCEPGKLNGHTGAFATPAPTPAASSKIDQDIPFLRDPDSFEFDAWHGHSNR